MALAVSVKPDFERYKLSHNKCDSMALLVRRVGYKQTRKVLVLCKKMSWLITVTIGYCGLFQIVNGYQMLISVSAVNN